ncbi:MFS transporter, partial [Thermodesulfobacteriota bacterium]
PSNPKSETAPSYGMLMILLLCAGISAACFHVPAPVVVNRFAGNQVGKGMSFYMTGGELARGVGPIAAVGAVSLFGFEGFYPVMILGVAASLWMYLRVRHLPVNKSAGKTISLVQTWRETRHILIPLTVILIARGFMQASMSTFLPTFINQETGNLWQAGLGLTLFEATGVTGILIMGSLSDRFGRRLTLLISFVGAPLSLFMFAATGGWIRFAALLTAGFTLLSTMPIMLAVVQEHAPSSPSAANGMFVMVSFVARSAIVVLVGMIADFTGLRTTYFIGAVIGLIAIPVILILPEKK